MRINKKTILTYIVIPFIVALTLASCIKDRFDLNKLTSSEWNPTFAVPLINSKMGVYDILAASDSSELVVIDQSGLIALVYRGELISYEAKDIVALPNQEEVTQLTLNASQSTTLTTVGSVTVQENFNYAYLTTSSVYIDSLNLKNGTLDINIISDFRHSGSLTITMPTLKKNNLPFQATIPINFMGSVPVNLGQNFDITGYSLAMTNGNNSIPINYSLTLTNSGQPLSPGENLTATMGLNGWEFSRIFGNFGQQIVSIDRDSINLNVFNNSSGGYFALVNPKLKLTVNNSFGFPVNIHFNTFESYNQITGVITPIALTTFPNPFAINYPALNQIGSTVSNNLLINKTNSNVDSLITPTPKFFIFGIEGRSNPVGPPVPPATNFMTDQSRFKIDMEVELPLEGFAYGFSIVDTLDFEFGENIEEVEKVLFRINVENGFPVDLRMQMVFLDQFLIPVDTMLSIYSNLVASGSVGANGKVSSPTTKITDVTYNRARIENLNKAKYVIVRGESNTLNASGANPSNPIIKLYDDYFFNVRVGMKVEGRVKL
jgi:hypothetical protein